MTNPSLSKLAAPAVQIARNTRRLFQLAWRMDPKVTALYYLTAAIGALVPLATSYVLKLLIDDLQLAQRSLTPVIPVTIAVVLAARYIISFLEGSIYWGLNQSYLDYVFRYKLQNEITNKFHEKISRLDIAYLEKPDIQDLITKTRDTMQWRLPDLLRNCSYLFRDVIAYLAAFIILLPYSWWIPVLLSAMTLPRLYLQAKYGAIQWSIWGSGAPQARKLWYLNHLLQEPLTVREVRITNSSAALLGKFKEIQQYLFGLNLLALNKYLRVLIIPPLIETIFLLAVAYHFLPAVLTGVLTIGSFTMLISMLEQLGNCSANASANLARIYENSLYAEHYFQFLSLPPLVHQSENPVLLKSIEPPRIEFRGVSFCYPGGQKVLDNISFTIEPGESVALVGHNGAGKSTIVKLLCRFYDVTEGEILINGVNLKDLSLPQWYKFLGTLFQEFVRYHFTVRENIQLGAPDRNDDQAMKEAAVKSGAAEFIEQLPQGYDQILGKEFDDGVELSGGQWQKLAIARAFYQSPPVLILDEPTSAIDAEAEYEIFNNLEKQYKSKTLILVSHRFSTVRNANKIIVLGNGRIIEVGSHETLMSKQGEYAKLFSLQARGYL